MRRLIVTSLMVLVLGADSQTVARAASFTLSATTNPVSVARGASIEVTATVTSAAAATVALDLEFYGPSGRRRFEKAYDSETFAAGQTRAYKVTWSVPANAPLGTYSVQMGVFSTDWNTQYTWQTLTTFSVVSVPVPTNTATSTSLPTSTPPVSTPTPLPTSTPTSTASPPAASPTVTPTQAAATQTPSPTTTRTLTPTSTAIPPTATPTSGGGVMSGLHVSGDKILNDSNQQVQLHGVNFSSFEYGCLSGYFNDGPEPPTQVEVNGMKSWNINVVRVVLNEDCWLGLNGLPSGYTAASYQQHVIAFVNLLTSNNVAVIVNLHFNAPGAHKATEQEPMADRDHSPAFWSDVANTYKANSAVLFEPYNEPHDISWACWRNGGCTVSGSQSGEGTFTVAGMQEMVTAIRGTGATNPIIVTGNNWGSDLSGWVANKPDDPLNQLIAGWHSYGDGLSCQTISCWDTTLASVLQVAPIVATEIGEFDCQHTYIDKVMAWLDSHDSQGYQTWTWGNFNCSRDPALLATGDNNFSGQPSQTYGQGFRDHLLSRP
jgi:endoglucanase